MGMTYTPNDALTLCGGYIRQMSVPAAQTTLMLDQVHSHMWVSKPDWNWSLVAMTAIPLVDGTQDYSLSNTDVYRFAHLRITQTDITPNQSRDFDPAEWLEPNLSQKGTIDSFKAIAWIPSISKLRLDCAAQVSGTATFQIDGEYQKNPIKIVTANLGTAFVFPDQYFDVFCEGFLYRLYKYTNDPRTGAVIITKGGERQFTGQLGVYMTRLREIMEAEDYGSGQAFRFPSEPLGLGRNAWPGTIF